MEYERFPASQAMHPVAPGAEYVPTTQGEQAEEIEPCSAVESNFPATQSVQSLEPEAEYFPFMQGVQVWATPSTFVSLHLPASQLEQ